MRPTRTRLPELLAGIDSGAVRAENGDRRVVTWTSRKGGKLPRFRLGPCLDLLVAYTTKSAELQSVRAPATAHAPQVLLLHAGVLSPLLAALVSSIDNPSPSESNVNYLM
jgi:hypothetical protein